MLVSELSAELREAVSPLVPLSDAVARAVPDVRVLAARCVDLAAREFTARALEHQKHLDAAAMLRAVPVIEEAESARRAMMAIEKIGHQENAPSVLLRAAGGAASTYLLLDRAAPEDADATLRALMQIVAAVARVVGMARRVGVNSALMVADFARLAA